MASSKCNSARVLLPATALGSPLAVGSPLVVGSPSAVGSVPAFRTARPVGTEDGHTAGSCTHKAGDSTPVFDCSYSY